MPAEIDLEDLVGPVVGPEDLPGGRKPAEGAEDVVDGERPAKDRGRDADADTDGEGDDRERAPRSRENRLKRTNQRLSREAAMLREEMAELRGAVGHLVREQHQRQSGSVDAAVEAAEQELQRAVDDGDSKAVVKATRALNEALDRQRRVKASADDGDTDPAPRGRQQRQAEQEFPEATADWLKRHSWYDVNLGDEDSEIANTVFTRLLKEGFAADDADTYDELDRRLAKRLPNRYRGGKGAADDDDDTDVPRTGGGSQRARAGSGGDASRIPPPSRTEMKAAEMAGIDLNDKDQRARWERHRAERLSKRA